VRAEPNPDSPPATPDAATKLHQLFVQAAKARSERRLADAERDWLQAVSLCREAGTSAQLAAALTAVGQIERDLHRLDSALFRYQEAAALYRAGDDPLKLAHTVRHVADIAREMKRPDVSAPAYDQSLAIYRSHPNTPPLDLANAIRGFAILQSDAGDLDRARSLWTEARDLYAAVGVEAGVAECDRRLADVA